MDREREHHEGQEQPVAQPKGGSQSAFAVLLVALFASTLGFGIIVPFLPIYAETLGASGIWIGLIFSGFSIARFFVMPLMGRLSDQRGRKGFIVLGLFLYALVSLGFVWADSPEMLTLLRFGQGVAAAMIIPIAQAYAGEISPPKREGKYMGLFSLALFAGFSAGPLLGGTLKDLYGISSSIYTLSALSLLATLLVFFLLPELRHAQKATSLSRHTIWEAWKNRVVRNLLFFRTTAAMCRGALIAFVPLFAHDKMHLSSSQIGIVITGNVLLAALLQAPFGMLADRANRRALVILGGFLFSGLLFVVPFIESFPQLLVLSLLHGASGALALPAATAIMVEEGRRHGMGVTMTLFNMSMSLGLASGPLLAGWTADRSGLNALFTVFSGIGLLGIAPYAFLNRKR